MKIEFYLDKEDLCQGALKLLFEVTENSHLTIMFSLLLEAPKITVIPQKSQIKIGESTEFTCIASGSPVPDLTWRKLNGSLPANSTVQGGVLTITNVTKNDAGLYECSALNIEGSTNQSSLLEIKGNRWSPL